jgi:predicted HTH transcriptional regulator
MNLHTGQPDPKIELAVLKSIAAFLNAGGGTVLVGADDSGKPVGLDLDGFLSADKLVLHLGNLVRDRLGNHIAPFIETEIASSEGKRILLVRCPPSTAPVYVKDGAASRFYVRTMASTAELAGSDAQHYIGERF